MLEVVLPWTAPVRPLEGPEAQVAAVRLTAARAPGVVAPEPLWVRRRVGVLAAAGAGESADGWALLGSGAGRAETACSVAAAALIPVCAAPPSSPSSGTVGGNWLCSGAATVSGLPSVRLVLPPSNTAASRAGPARQAAVLPPCPLSTGPSSTCALPSPASMPPTAATAALSTAPACGVSSTPPCPCDAASPPCAVLPHAASSRSSSASCSGSCSWTEPQLRCPPPSSPLTASSSSSPSPCAAVESNMPSSPACSAARELGSSAPLPLGLE